MAWIARVSSSGGLRNKISEILSKRCLSGSGKPPKQVLTFSRTGKRKLEVAEDFSKPVDGWDWYGTFAGRKRMAMWVGFGGAVGLTFISFGLNIYGTTVMKEQYEERSSGEKMSVYKRVQFDAPEGVDIPDKIVRMFNVNQTRAGLDEDNMDRMEVFITYMLDPVVTGCSLTRQGGIVGVPIHQTWTSLDQVDLENVRIKPTFNKWFSGYKIPPSADPGDIETLKESFVLSEEAIHFSLAKNLYIAGSWQAVINTFLPGSIWMLHYLTAININDKLHLFQRPRILRMAIQGMMGIGSLLIFIGLKNVCDGNNCWNAIYHVTRTVKEAEAAVEFYTKTLERNKVLRKILGDEGEYYFQEDGEIVGYVYEMPELTGTATHLKYSQDILEKKLAEVDAS